MIEILTALPWGALIGTSLAFGTAGVSQWFGELRGRYASQEKVLELVAVKHQESPDAQYALIPHVPHVDKPGQVQTLRLRPQDVQLDRRGRRLLAQVAGELQKAHTFAQSSGSVELLAQVNTLRARLLENAEAWKESVLVGGRSSENDRLFLDNVEKIGQVLKATGVQYARRRKMQQSLTSS